MSASPLKLVQQFQFLRHALTSCSGPRSGTASPNSSSSAEYLACASETCWKCRSWWPLAQPKKTFETSRRSYTPASVPLPRGTMNPFAVNGNVAIGTWTRRHDCSKSPTGSPPSPKGPIAGCQARSGSMRSEYPHNRTSSCHLFHAASPRRSEEHTSELQSLTNLVCRLLLEKKKKLKIDQPPSKERVISDCRPTH